MGDHQELAFLTCLKEIEIRYISLPKGTRLRIERWVEKLVVVGQNILWKKHRNMYARLLLGMILSKNFTDPFDMNPPDGPLPSFPSHLRSKLKNISGPHESGFWRNIYTKLPSVEENIRVNSSPSYGFESEWRFDMGQSETESLRQLIQEQTRRIEILEDQITSERLQHESDMVRFMEHHRGEITTLKQRMSPQRRSSGQKPHLNVSNWKNSSHSILPNYNETVGTPYLTTQEKSGPYFTRGFETEDLPQSMSQSKYSRNSSNRSIEGLYSPSLSRIISPDIDRTERDESLHSTTLRGRDGFYQTKFRPTERKTDLERYLERDDISIETKHDPPERDQDQEESQTKKISDRFLSSISPPRPLNIVTKDITPQKEKEIIPRKSAPIRPPPHLSLPYHPQSNIVIEEGGTSIPEEETEFLNYLENFQTELKQYHYNR